MTCKLQIAVKLEMKVLTMGDIMDVMHASRQLYGRPCHPTPPTSVPVSFTLTAAASYGPVTPVQQRYCLPELAAVVAAESWQRASGSIKQP
jgi:hypothetical protein